RAQVYQAGEGTMFWVMKRQLSCAVCMFCLLATPAVIRASRVINDLSSVRGFNYTPAGAAGHAGFWEDYDAATVDKDLALAVRLNLNEARVFMPYDAWAGNKAAFREHVVAFVRACNHHNIGVMPVLAPGD